MGEVLGEVGGASGDMAWQAWRGRALRRDIAVRCEARGEVWGEVGG